MDYKVCVVEDDLFTRIDAVCILEEAGFPVEQFSTGDGVASYLETNAPDIAFIFTDVMMSGKLGWRRTGPAGGGALALDKGRHHLVHAGLRNSSAAEQRQIHPKALAPVPTIGPGHGRSRKTMIIVSFKGFWGWGA